MVAATVNVVHLFDAAFGAHKTFPRTSERSGDTRNYTINLDIDDDLLLARSITMLPSQEYGADLALRKNERPAEGSNRGDLNLNQVDRVFAEFEQLDADSFYLDWMTRPRSDRP